MLLVMSTVAVRFVMKDISIKVRKVVHLIVQSVLQDVKLVTQRKVVRYVWMDI